ncbi:MAG: serine hydrolase domain-containing protein [Fimbriimonas sp.]
MNALLLSATLLGQAAANPVKLPDTPNARFLQAFVDVVNAPNASALQKFAVDLDRDDLMGLSTPNHLRRLEKIREQSGGLIITGSSPDGNVVIAKTKRDGREFMFRGGLNPNGKGWLGVRRWYPREALAGSFKFPETVANRGEAVKAIQALLDSLAREDRWNGVVLVAKGDEVLLHTAHGVADRSFGTPIGKDTKFNLASLGKMFTTALVGSLVRDGKLGLDDPLGKYRPDWPDAAAREKVTVRMLLGHTGGLGSIFNSPNYDRSRRYRNSTDLTDALVGEKLSGEPGKAFDYSNGGFVMLGSIIERVTGQDYMTVARDRIFEPLGMKATGWADGNEAIPNLAPIYDRDLLDPLGLEPKRRDGMFAGWRGDAHGGGYSTASDLFRFMRAIKGNRFLTPTLTEEFLKPGPNPTYGLGFSFDPAGGLKAVGHNGHARADASVLWDLDVTVIALGNDLSEPAPLTAMLIREFIAKQKEVF